MTGVVTIIGVGALGSHLVQFLRSEPVELRIIDFDRVEQRNLFSQFHGKPSAGKLKTEALQQTMQFLWGVKLKPLPRRLEPTNVKELIHGESALVIDCVDNGATRRLIQQHVRDHGLPCLHGALAPNGGFGRVIWDEHFVIDDEAGQGAATCEEAAHLPFIGITSTYLAYAAQRFLRTGKKIGFSISPAGAFAT